MKYPLISILLTFFLLSSEAIGADFTGTWSIDLRLSEEKKTKIECGIAEFSLNQLADNSVIGTYAYATPGCGRLTNSSIEGTAKGKTAILLVTSDRNGAVFKGKATIKNGKLYWHIIKQISSSDSPYDGLILEEGILEINK